MTELFRKSYNWRQIYNQASSTLNTSNDVSNVLRRKNYLDLIRRLRNGCLITFKIIQKQPPEVFCKNALLVKTSQYSPDEQKNNCVGVSF